MSIFRQVIDTVRLLPIGGPGVCNLAVTNVCNARCDFCNYAWNKKHVKEKIWIDYDEFRQAVDILYDRGIRFMTLVGGEPTLHPKILDIVAQAAEKGIHPTIVTNGSLLTPAFARELKASGLKTLFVSIDSSSAESHEKNRGLPGVCERIREANRECVRLEMKTVASVTINRLIESYPALLRFLLELGIRTVNFAYPKRELHSPALSFSHNSELIDYDAGELIHALETIKSLKDSFSILNSREALAEILRFACKDDQIYPCFAGYKYFYLDYHLDVYRCDFWPTRMGSVHEFRDTPFVREHCTRCISGCYRDASVLMHAGVSLGDAIQCLHRGDLSSAVRHLGKRTNFRSIKTLAQDWTTLRKLARTHQSVLRDRECLCGK